DADVRRRAVQDDEPLLGGRLDDVRPDRAGLHADTASRSVDLDPAHALGLDEDRVFERTDRAGAVTGSLRRNPQAVDAREVDDRDDVVGRLDQGDGERALVDGEVPGAACLVPPRVVGDDQVAREAGAKGMDVDSARGLGVDAQDGHLWLLSGRSRGCKSPRAAGPFGSQASRGSAIHTVWRTIPAVSEPQAIAQSLEEVVPGVWHWHVSDERIGGFISAAHAVRSDEGVVLIDPLPLAAEAMSRLGEVSAICL